MSDDMTHDEKAAAYERIARDAREDKLIAFCRTYEGESSAHNLIKRLDRENDQLRRDRAEEEQRSAEARAQRAQNARDVLAWQAQAWRLAEVLRMLVQVETFDQLNDVQDAARAALGRLDAG